jgi:hypothetical protein
MVCCLVFDILYSYGNNEKRSQYGNEKMFNLFI